MKIFINNLSGKNIAFEIESSDTVKSLKAKVQEREGIPAAQQRLYFARSQLTEDGKTLGDYKIQNESVGYLLHHLTCKCKSCLGIPEEISASIIHENKTVDSINWNLMVVIEAKSRIQSWERVGASISERFKFGGDFHLQPVSSTRALFFIENTKEREYLIQQEPWFFEYIQLQFVPWSSNMNLLSAADIVEISAKWVLVKGVPFSLWNSEMFETIGAQCGGLLEVSHFTKFGLNLSAIKLRVKGPLLSDAFTIQVNHKPMPFTVSVSVAADQSEKMESTTGRIRISSKKSCLRQRKVKPQEVEDINPKKKMKI
ncbi:hypothetical protein MKW92_016041 [Papaver armeniacum]|nr:hypothetical protein MKW92_016041 [Papaver armeniacum]